MGTGEKDEVGRLFADITAHLEDAHEFATAGQNPRRSTAERTAQASDIRRHVKAIDTALNSIERVISDASG